MGIPKNFRQLQLHDFNGFRIRNVMILKRIANQSTWERGRNRKSPKVVRRGCKRSFEPRERKASCTGVAPVQTGLHMVQETLGGPLGRGSKDLLHPLLTTFGDFLIFDMGSCNRTLLRRVLEGSLKEVLLRRVLRRHLVRVSIET